MTDRPAKPADRYVVSVFAPPGATPRYVICLRIFEWWNRKNTWFEKTKETMVGGIIYDTADEAIAVRDKLNSEIGNA